MSGNHIHFMGMMRSIIVGLFTWYVFTVFLFRPEMALAAGVVFAFFSESAQHYSELRGMHHQSHQLQGLLQDANSDIDNLERALTQRHIQLNKAIEEIQRRDAVGSPAARELLKRQEEAMEIASQALASRHERNDMILKSMERLLELQTQQTTQMQRTMGDVLERLAMQPRGNVTLTDSVLVQEPQSPPRWGSSALGTANSLQELDEWLEAEAASSL